MFLLIIFAVPYFAYILVKWGMAGYYSAKRMWDEPHEDDNDEIKE